MQFKICNFLNSDLLLHPQINLLINSKIHLLRIPSREKRLKIEKDVFKFVFKLETIDWIGHLIKSEWCSFNISDLEGGKALKKKKKKSWHQRRHFRFDEINSEKQKETFIVYRVSLTYEFVLHYCNYSMTHWLRQPHKAQRKIFLVSFFVIFLSWIKKH